MTEEASSQQANPEPMIPGPSNSECPPVQQAEAVAPSGNANSESQPEKDSKGVTDQRDQMQNAQSNGDGTAGPQEGNEEKKKENPNIAPAEVSATPASVGIAKHQPATPEIPMHRIGANRSPVRVGSSSVSQKSGERKDHEPAASNSGPSDADPASLQQPKKEKPAQSDFGKKVTSAVGKNANILIKKALEFQDPTEPLGDPPSLFPLGDQVRQWSDELMLKGFLLLQCVDKEVLRSAGYAIAYTDTFSSWTRRALRFGPWNWAEEPDRLHKMLFHPKMTESDRQTLIVVFGYWRNSDKFLQMLPQDDEEIEFLERRKRPSLRILVLVTPDRLRAAGLPTPFDGDYAVPPLDFLNPVVTAKFQEPSATKLINDLRRQFEKKLWGNDEEGFHKNVRSFLRTGNLEAEIENRNQLLKQSDPEAALRARQSELGRDMLNDDTPLENAVIFTATYFEELPADDFQRVLVNLLGERSIDAAMLTPEPQSSAAGNGSTVQTRPKLLRQTWSEERQAILKKCRLRVLDGTPPVVGFESPDFRGSLQRRFESEFFFLFDELCERVMATRLFFDDKETVSEGVARLLVNRIKNDPFGYGQTFLTSLVLPLIPSPEGGRDSTPERLRKGLATLSDDRRRDLLNRLGPLLNSLIEEQTSSVVEGILRRLLDLVLHEDVLQLLSWIIHPSFLTRRVEVLKRIVNEGTVAMRAKVGNHLLHWAKTGGPRTALLLQAVHGWCDNSLALSSVAANQFFVQLCALTISPPATWENHPIAIALATAESETCVQEIATWLLSLDSSSAKHLDVEGGLGWFLDSGMRDTEEVQFIVALIMTFQWIMPRGAADEDALLTILTNSDLGTTILIVWFSSYERALMASLPGSMPPELYAGTLRATLVADCALALRNKASGSPDNGNLDQLARAVARLERRERATLLAHWAAMAAALGDCLVVPRSSQFALQRETAPARNKLIERWTAIRSGLTDFRSRVLSAVANSHKETN